MSVLSHVRLFATPWTVALQAPLSMEFSRQEYWSGLPFPSSGDLSDPATELMSPEPPALQVDSLPLEPQGHVNKCFSMACLQFFHHMLRSLLLSTFIYFL